MVTSVLWIFLCDLQFLLFLSDSPVINGLGLQLLVAGRMHLSLHPIDCCGGDRPHLGGMFVLFAMGRMGLSCDFLILWMIHCSFIVNFSLPI